MTNGPLVEVEGLRKGYGGHRQGVPLAVSDVSFAVQPGERLGVVGVAGAGKTTLGRIVAGLDEPDAGTVRFEGVDLASVGRGDQRGARRRIRLISEADAAALGRRTKVGAALEEVLAEAKADRGRRRELTLAALTAVGLRPAEEMCERRVRGLSEVGVQQLVLARAVVLRPRLVVADEPGQRLAGPLPRVFLRLMADVGERNGISWLHLTDDISLAAGFCHRIVVLDAGRVVDQGLPEQVMARPLHPASRALVAAARPPDHDDGSAWDDVASW